MRISVRAKPRAKKSRLLSVTGLAVEIAIAAPPADGAANEELVVVLAEALDVPRRSLVLAVGAGSKQKLVDVTGLTPEEITARLERAVRS